MIEAYITNLGKYNAGYLEGGFLKFPTTMKEVQALFSRIGVDGRQYEEYIITDYESKVDGLADYLGEYENIDELNYLAALLEKLDENEELEKFEAAIALGDYTGSVKDLINLTQNLDCYDFYPDIADEDDLGWYYAEELGALQIPDELKSYFDYEAYGRDIAMENTCAFVNAGFIMGDTRSFVEHYKGLTELPAECRVFAYPKKEERSILETLKQHREAPSSVHTGERRAIFHNTR